MQINIGDKVRFLSETGGGVVTRILDAKTVMILNDEDEFEIPSLKSDLVVIESSQTGNTAQTKTSNTTTSSSPSPSKQSLFVEKEEVYAAFVPKESSVASEGPLELYLINDTNQILLYNYYNEKGQRTEGVTAGNLDPKSKILLAEYELKDLNELSSCHFQILYYQQGISSIKNPLTRTIKIQAVKFYKSSSYKDTAYFHQDAILYKLTGGSDLEQKLDELSDKDFKQAIREKKTSGKVKVAEKSNNSNDQLIEVDLHINALIDSVTGLSNADILEYQMNKFHDTLRQYQYEKGKKIVFIHGIGNGTLKQRVLSELKRKYRKFYQQDASFKEYGWGATMVTIR
ncbi:DUF2027 domain-containing protein [Labilibaculum sp.]|uniref:DUF2027 domain-containing protein n=1 Tax=Labilibaculum sp. TaxID=2060723 RepID=UPI0035650751